MALKLGVEKKSSCIVLEVSHAEKPDPDLYEDANKLIISKLEYNKRVLLAVAELRILSLLLNDLVKFVLSYSRTFSLYPYFYTTNSFKLNFK